MERLEIGWRKRDGREAEMGAEKEGKAIEPGGRRSVKVKTSMAEASVL